MPITLLFEISVHDTEKTGWRKKRVFFATYLARIDADINRQNFLNFRNFRQSSVILPMVAKLIVILICDFSVYGLPKSISNSHNRIRRVILHISTKFEQNWRGRPFSTKSGLVILTIGKITLLFRKLRKFRKFENPRLARGAPRRAY